MTTSSSATSPSTASPARWSSTLEFDGVNVDPWHNTKAGFTAATEINRKDFGLEWNVALETGGVLVSDKVKVQLDIQAVKV